MEKTGRLEENTERSDSGHLRSRLAKNGLRGDLLRNISDGQESDLRIDIKDHSLIRNESSASSVQETDGIEFRIPETNLSEGMISKFQSIKEQEDNEREYRLPEPKQAISISIVELIFSSA